MKPVDSDVLSSASLGDQMVVAAAEQRKRLCRTLWRSAAENDVLPSIVAGADTSPAAA